MAQACTTDAISVTFHNAWIISNFSSVKRKSLKSKSYNNLDGSICWHYVLNITSRVDTRIHSPHQIVDSMPFPNSPVYAFSLITGTYQLDNNQISQQYSEYDAIIVPVIDSCNSLTNVSVEIDQDDINQNHSNNYEYNYNKESFKISGKTKTGTELGRIIIEQETFEQFLKDDTLTLRLKFTLHKQPAVKPVVSELLNNYTSLLSNKQLSDVTIQVGKKTFYAQRAILSIRSPVFAAMFQSGMQESQQNVITIKDIQPEVVQEVLRFIYTDEVIGLETMAHELLAAADKYSLDKLRKMCENHLLGHLGQETIFETLVLADLYHAQELKDHAIQFICTKIKMMQDIDWKSLCSTYPDLAADIFKQLAIK